MDDAPEAPTPEVAVQASDPSKPRTCGAAVALGLKSFETGDYEAAIDHFTTALELPGNGAMRMAGAHTICLEPMNSRGRRMTADTLSQHATTAQDAIVPAAVFIADSVAQVWHQMCALTLDTSNRYTARGSSRPSAC